MFHVTDFIPVEVLPLFSVLPAFWGNCCCDEPSYLYGAFGFKNSVTSGPYNSCHGYDPVANGWTVMAAHSPTRFASNSASIVGESYTQGGINSSVVYITDNAKYDFAGNSWTDMTAVPSPARGRGSATEWDDAYVYNIGGTSGVSYYTDNDEYDVVGDSWTAKTNMSTPTRAFFGSFALADGNIHVFGGQNSGTWLNDHDGYDVAGDSWDFFQNLGSPTRSRLSDGGVVSDIGYTMGGANNTPTSIADVDAYDYAGDTWTAKTNMPTARMYNSVKDHGAYVYSVCGVTSTAGASPLYQYDPVANTHATKTSYLEADVIEISSFR